MGSRLCSGLRLGAAVVLLACGVGLGFGPAQARTAVAVDLNFGYPAYGTVAPMLPSGAVAVGVGPGRYWYRGGLWYRPWGARYVVVAPPVGVVAPVEPVVMAERPSVSVPPSRPDPIIYPRNGQDGNQTEYDRQECNRWATTQPSAVADATIFQRAVEVCMDARGYTMK